eukprot:EG_transcript_6859
MAAAADAGRGHRPRSVWHRRQPSTEPATGHRERLAHFLHPHQPHPVPRSSPEMTQECNLACSTSQLDGGNHVRHYIVKSAASTASRGLFRLFGHDFDSETDKILKEYYELDPFATITVEGIGPLPTGYPKVVVHCTAVDTGRAQAAPEVGPKGWSVTFNMADRLCDITVHLLTKSGKVGLMTGVQVPSIDVAPVDLDLPLVTLPDERDKEAATVGVLKVRFSVAYNRDVEKKNLWEHLVPVQDIIYPEMDWDAVVLAVRSARARILLKAESSGLAPKLEAWNRLLLFDSPRRSALVFGTVMGVNGVLGHYHLWVPGLFALFVGSFLVGYLHQDFWTEKVCKPSHMKVERTKKTKQELGKVMVSTAWLNWRVFDRFLSLATWQHPRSSVLALGFFSGCFLLTFVLPGWVMLNFLLVVYLSISVFIRYPILRCFTFASHMDGVRLRSAPSVHPYVGRLFVTIHCAHGFRASDHFSTDPYVAVMVGQQMDRTKSKLKDMHPLFEETMQFVVFSPNAHVQVLLWDWDRSSSDDFLGEGQFQTTGITGCTTSKSNVWVDIRLRPACFADYRRFVSGRVRVSWQLEDLTPP